MLFYIYMYNRHVFSINPLSRVNTIVTISCRGRVVTNVVSTCDPTPLYYMQLNIIKLSAPALGLNTIIFKHVYWYMQQISGERLQDHWSSGSFFKLILSKNDILFLAHLSRRLTR